MSRTQTNKHQGMDTVGISTDFPDWSFYRSSLFNSCKLAFRLHYDLARQASDPFVEDATCRLDRLHNLKPVDLWIGEVLSDTIRQICYLDSQRVKTEHAFADKLRKLVMRRLSREFVSCANEHWRQDRKALNLFETYYGENGFFNWDSVQAQAERALQSLQSLGLLSLLTAVPAMHWVRLSPPLELSLDICRIWLAPTCAWRDHGRIRFVDLRLSPLPHPDLAQQRAALYGLYAEHNLFTPHRKVSLLTASLNATPAQMETGATTDAVTVLLDRVGTDLLHFQEALSTPVPKPQPSQKRSCQRCSYQEYCHPRDPDDSETSESETRDLRW